MYLDVLLSYTSTAKCPVQHSHSSVSSSSIAPSLKFKHHLLYRCRPQIQTVWYGLGSLRISLVFWEASSKNPAHCYSRWMPFFPLDCLIQTVSCDKSSQENALGILMCSLWSPMAQCLLKSGHLPFSSSVSSQRTWRRPRQPQMFAECQIMAKLISPAAAWCILGCLVPAILQSLS